MFWIPSQLEGAYLGQDVTLECHSEAYPKSINYWVKEDGQMLISSNTLHMYKKEKVESDVFKLIPSISLCFPPQTINTRL